MSNKGVAKRLPQSHATMGVPKSPRPPSHYSGYFLPRLTVVLLSPNRLCFSNHANRYDCHTATNHLCVTTDPDCHAAATHHSFPGLCRCQLEKAEGGLLGEADLEEEVELVERRPQKRLAPQLALLVEVGRCLQESEPLSTHLAPIALPGPPDS